MENLKTHGQSTKESYRDDIETSRKQKTVYKNYEYFDDYSYGNSTSIGFYLEKDEDEEETYLYLFQDDGPKELETLRKFLEWKRSGKSDEIGHKGGGNKRNIYGMHCTEAFICMRIDDQYVIRCATKPNSLYDLSISNIDEETFRSESDSSTYITNPEKLKIKNLPGWYSATYNKIKEESKITPNFLIRFELTEIPEEYSSNDFWTEYINQIRAKQYNIPIYFKNEFLNMTEYEKYDNIDLIGINDPNKIHDTVVKLYINKITKQFYLNYESKYINVKEITDILDNSTDIVEWGEINMFIVSKDYFDNNFKLFNTDNKNRMIQEDLYGIYLYLNNKITNYLPFEGKLLGDSRNNLMEVEGIKRTSLFRMILRPNTLNCKNYDIFESLIETREIKALTGFTNKSPWKEIKDLSMKLFKDENILMKSASRKKKLKTKETSTKSGGNYIVYFGNGLWKYGMVTNYSNMKDRLSTHKCESIDNIIKYKDFLKNKEDPKNKICITMYACETDTPKATEENIRIILEKNKTNKITLIESCRSTNETREFFVCDDFDYIINIIESNLR